MEEVKEKDNEDDKGEDGKEEEEKSENAEEKDYDDKTMFKAGQRCLLRFIKLLLL